MASCRGIRTSLFSCPSKASSRLLTRVLLGLVVILRCEHECTSANTRPARGRPEARFRVLNSAPEDRRAVKPADFITAHPSMSTSPPPHSPPSLSTHFPRSHPYPHSRPSSHTHTRGCHNHDSRHSSGSAWRGHAGSSISTHFISISFVTRTHLIHVHIPMSQPSSSCCCAEPLLVPVSSHSPLSKARIA